MITTIVNAIEGPISSVVSGWLGESGKWPQNLVPTSVGMPGDDTPSGATEHTGDGETEQQLCFSVLNYRTSITLKGRS